MSKVLEWTEDEKLYIRTHYATKTAKQIAEVLSRNHRSIKRFVKNEGLTGKSRQTVWIGEKLSKLKELYAETTNVELAKIFDVSESCIGGAAFKYRLLKSPEHIVRERKGCFPKGNTTWNKGMKGQRIAGSEKGWFKKGGLPHNTKEDGAVSVRYDKNNVPHRFVRIALRQWIGEHIFVWQNAHGIVPDGGVVRHINGDTLDNRLENLELITKGENMARNTIINYPADLQQTIRVLGKLKRKIKEHGKDKNERREELHD